VKDLERLTDKCDEMSEELGKVRQMSDIDSILAGAAASSHV
jgi:hypothetical protein